MNIHDLYEKVGQFEASLSPESKALSQCKKGCSQCCMVDLSVFQVEADNIVNWFSRLPEIEQEAKRKEWSQHTDGCAFLVHNACTIYEARPLICRTQGLAFSFKQDEESFVDICPLNDEMLDVLTEKEVMNLDLLNLILSQLEKLEASGADRKRVSLTDLRKSLAVR